MIILYQNIIVEEKGRTAIITLNRPESYNALNIVTLKEILDSFQRCMENSDVRVIVITGSGRAFCSGGDLKTERERLENNSGDYFRDLIKYFHKLILDIRLAPKPIIASINGPAAGSGFSLALACDLRIASDKATLKQASTSIALVPVGGLTFLLPRIVGLGKASELIFLDKSIAAGEAEKLGLVNYVVPQEKLMETSMDVARQLAKGPSLAYARAKALLNKAIANNLESQLENEGKDLVLTSETEDYREAVAAFLVKREPKFQGR